MTGRREMGSSRICLIRFRSFATFDCFPFRADLLVASKDGGERRALGFPSVEKVASLHPSTRLDRPALRVLHLPAAR